MSLKFNEIKNTVNHSQETMMDLLMLQRRNIDYFFDNLDAEALESFVKELTLSSGTLFFSGVGKSSFIAQKIVSSLTSFGVRSSYLSSSEALHGDIGAVQENDVVVLISKSGESVELLDLIPILSLKKARCFSVVCNRNSRLAKESECFVELPLLRELCPFDLAPLTSSSLQMIFGDVLCSMMIRSKEISLDLFGENHPAGKIGKRVLTRVEDLMLKGVDLPLCRVHDSIAQVVLCLSKKRCGCVLVVDSQGVLLGIFTDGDLSRAFLTYGSSVFDKKVDDLMTKKPKTISEGDYAWTALKKMEENPQNPVTVLPVIDANHLLKGLIRMHDILQAGI